ncbi:MAG: hypothetical protein HOP08_12870 [Cyclobacteriaceae bacterium]|nr:hypothetical protein [Cyclobacteriaceae bacterium]
MRDRFVQLLIRWIFIVLPTAVIGYITLVYVNFSYTALTSNILTQSIYFGTGLLIAYSLYFFRIRWLVTFILLWFAYWLIGKIIVKLPGEFDVFYATARFQLYSALFILGWIFGFLLVRVKFSYIILFGILGVSTVVAISNTVDVSISYILYHLLPVVVYGLYMLFVSPLLVYDVEMDLKKSGRLVLRFALFLILVILAFLFVGNLLRDDLKAVEKELVDRGAKSDKDGDKKEKDGGYDQRYGLMDKPGGKDDGFKLKDTMKISSKMSQSDQLMFCSRLNNYFPDGTPQPLYFVYHYLTKYDPAKESFIRDANVPYLDEFDADPSEVAIFHSRQDSSVIRNALGKKNRKVVESEVYLSSNTWKHALLAPASAFYIQSIPVEKDFQKTFISAYKVKSYVSELNNAYFVYNPSANPQLESFQEERYSELRTVRDYSKVDPEFYNYYIDMPKGVIYDSIALLAKKITAGIVNPADKVLAIRDHFLARDKNGKRIFRYTLKPGTPSDPNIPNTSMLNDFLFKTHAGYCTYYAGASLFLLRSVGIPARFTTGFATINRSDKNKGWYWFYASQAHAWTQVYFPGYGWMDFDMTIGNEDQQNAPKPDGTPPLPPPEPWLVLNAKAESVVGDKSKRMDATFSNIIYFDEKYQLNKSVTRSIDVSVCRVLYDKKDTTLSAITAGDSLVIVSYKDEAKAIPKPRKGVSIENQVDNFPAPIVADEIHIKPKPKKEKKEDVKGDRKNVEEKGMSWKEMLLLAGKIAGGVIVFIFLLPLLYLIYLVIRTSLAKNDATKADAIYQTALYQFHMAGAERIAQTPLDYARTKVDPVFNTSFYTFMTVYLRLKYGRGTLREGDAEIIHQFGNSKASAIRKTKGFFKVALNYFNIVLASRYFLQSENEYENQ